MPRLLAMTPPDDTADLAGWLEERWARGELHRLAAELSAIHPPIPAPALQELCGGRLAAVLAGGLGSLPTAAIGRLMRHPSRLAELADRIAAEGGPYWDTLADPVDDRKAAAVWAKVQASLTPARPVSRAPKPMPAAPRAPAGRSRLADAFKVFAAAACIAGIGFFLAPYYARTPVTPPALASNWGWQKADTLPQDAPPADYLDRVASLAEEWRGRKPDTPLELVADISALRQGCARLQLMTHRPLSEAQAADLRKRCNAWAKKLDQHLLDLEGGATVAKVRQDVTGTIDALSAALHGQATELRAKAG